MGDSKSFQRALRVVRRDPVNAACIVAAARDVLINISAEDRIMASAELMTALRELSKVTTQSDEAVPMLPPPLVSDIAAAGANSMAAVTHTQEQRAGTHAVSPLSSCL